MRAYGVLFVCVCALYTEYFLCVKWLRSWFNGQFESDRKRKMKSSKRRREKRATNPTKPTKNEKDKMNLTTARAHRTHLMLMLLLACPHSKPNTKKRIALHWRSRCRFAVWCTSSKVKWSFYTISRTHSGTRRRPRSNSFQFCHEFCGYLCMCACVANASKSKNAASHNPQVIAQVQSNYSRQSDYRRPEQSDKSIGLVSISPTHTRI